jgi:hypothetical protein
MEGEKPGSRIELKAEEGASVLLPNDSTVTYSTGRISSNQYTERIEESSFEPLNAGVVNAAEGGIAFAAGVQHTWFQTFAGSDPSLLPGALHAATFGDIDITVTGFVELTLTAGAMTHVLYVYYSDNTGPGYSVVTVYLSSEQVITGQRIGMDMTFESLRSILPATHRYAPILGFKLDIFNTGSMTARTDGYVRVNVEFRDHYYNSSVLGVLLVDSGSSTQELIVDTTSKVDVSVNPSIAAQIDLTSNRPVSHDDTNYKASALQTILQSDVIDLVGPAELKRSQPIMNICCSQHHFHEAAYTASIKSFFKKAARGVYKGAQWLHHNADKINNIVGTVRDTASMFASDNRARYEAADRKVQFDTSITQVRILSDDSDSEAPDVPPQQVTLEEFMRIRNDPNILGTFILPSNCKVSLGPNRLVRTMVKTSSGTRYVAADKGIKSRFASMKQIATYIKYGPRTNCECGHHWGFNCPLNSSLRPVYVDNQPYIIHIANRHFKAFDFPTGVEAEAPQARYSASDPGNLPAVVVPDDSDDELDLDDVAAVSNDEPVLVETEDAEPETKVRMYSLKDANDRFIARFAQRGVDKATAYYVTGGRAEHPLSHENERTSLGIILPLDKKENAQVPKLLLTTVAPDPTQFSMTRVEQFEVNNRVLVLCSPDPTGFGVDVVAGLHRSLMSLDPNFLIKWSGTAYLYILSDKFDGTSLTGSMLATLCGAPLNGAYTASAPARVRPRAMCSPLAPAGKLANKVLKWHNMAVANQLGTGVNLVVYADPESYSGVDRAFSNKRLDLSSFAAVDAEMVIKDLKRTNRRVYFCFSFLGYLTLLRPRLNKPAPEVEVTPLEVAQVPSAKVDAFMKELRNAEAIERMQQSLAKSTKPIAEQAVLLRTMIARQIATFDKLVQHRRSQPDLKERIQQKRTEGKQLSRVDRALLRDTDLDTTQLVSETPEFRDITLRLRAVVMKLDDIKSAKKRQNVDKQVGHIQSALTQARKDGLRISTEPYTDAEGKQHEAPMVGYIRNKMKPLVALEKTLKAILAAQSGAKTKGVVQDRIAFLSALAGEDVVV